MCSQGPGWQPHINHAVTRGLWMIILHIVAKIELLEY